MEHLANLNFSIGKMGHRNYSVSLCWYSTPLRVVEYHKLDWIIPDVPYYLVEYLLIIPPGNAFINVRLKIANDVAKLVLLDL